MHIDLSSKTLTTPSAIDGFGPLGQLQGQTLEIKQEQN